MSGDSPEENRTPPGSFVRELSTFENGGQSNPSIDQSHGQRHAEMDSDAEDQSDTPDRQSETVGGHHPIDRLCPKCLSTFDYRLEPTMDPIFDGKPPVTLCIVKDGGTDSIEAIFVHQSPRLRGSTMSEGFTVEFSPTRAPCRRNRYKPRSGNGDGYWRICEEWNGCRWRIRGREPISDVVCKSDTERLVE